MNSSRQTLLCIMCTCQPCLKQSTSLVRVHDIFGIGYHVLFLLQSILGLGRGNPRVLGLRVSGIDKHCSLQHRLVILQSMAAIIQGLAGEDHALKPRIATCTHDSGTAIGCGARHGYNATPSISLYMSVHSWEILPRCSTIF